MREWTAHVGNNGFNLMDGGLNLFDLRFADDILIFTESRRWLNSWFPFNFGKNKCHYEGNRTSPHHYDHIWSDSQSFLARDAGQKWLGSMLTSRGPKLQNVALQYHPQQASKVFHMNPGILPDRKAFILESVYVPCESGLS